MKFAAIGETLAVLATIFAIGGCAHRNWETFRHDQERTGNQKKRSALSDPAKVGSL